MFIILIGPPASGKSTLLRHLQSTHSFTHLSLANISTTLHHDPTTQAAFEFPTLTDMLNHATANWTQRFITRDVNTVEALEEFTKRPFVLVVAVDAPILLRFAPNFRPRSCRRRAYPPPFRASFVQQSKPPRDALTSLLAYTNLSIQNAHSSLHDLCASVDALDPPLVDESRLRPSWDSYFMLLAELASRRSNCMKRRVGAVLVRDKRVMSTGYNGTPRGMKNCNEGGCPRCNLSSRSGVALDECLCLHAEENALLEAGRERTEGGIVYCNTCPCLRCSVKLAQVGIREVVYSKSYSMDVDAKRILEEAGVKLRQMGVVDTV
ncbi:hypothetical protein BT69DRAFT_1229707 [Atractiella rhizophila]|nr:hypothetical protein BT69DRAFT_1229707 [Atractiella rhizophila]